MDPNPELSDSLTYDITTWALPYAYGLEAYAMTSPMPRTDAWTSEVTSPSLDGEGPAYAYVLHYHTDLGTPVLAGLLKAGVTARVVKRPIEVDGTTFPRGAVVITRRNNEALWPDMAARLTDLTANVPGMTVARLESGMVTSGPDLGAYDVAPIDAPRVAVVMGDEVSSLSFGEVWFTFEEVWNYPMTAVRGLEWMDWDAYDVVVLPRGWYDVDEDQKDAISAWIREGGRLVALGAACNLGVEALGTFALQRRRRPSRAPGRTRRPRGGRPIRPVRVVGTQRHPQRHSRGGVRHRIGCDAPLGLRLRRHLLEHENVGQVLRAPRRGAQRGRVLRGEADPVSGFAGSRANQGLRESLSFGVHDMGRYHVVYLADNVMFRAFWKDGHKFFANAVFFGSIM